MKRRNIIRFFMIPVLVAACFSAAAAGVPSEDELLEAIKGKSPEERLTYLLAIERGTKLDPVLFFQTGNAYYANNQPDSALAYYDRVVKLDPENFKAYVNMGIAYDESGQNNAAQGAYRMALKIKPEDVLAMCNLGYNLVHQGKVAEGVKYYTRALEIDPDSGQAHYNLGLAFADLKVFNEAITEWVKVVELDPESELGKTAAENVRLIKAYLAAEP